MKKRIGIIFIMVFMLVITACAQDNDMGNLALSEYGEIEDTGIEVRITGETVTTETDSVMIEYINNTDTQVMFGEEPHLEIKKEDSWYVIPLKEGTAWIDIAYMLPPKGSIEKKFLLKFYYENLSPGHYRIIKKFFMDSGNAASAVEFDIQ